MNVNYRCIKCGRGVVKRRIEGREVWMHQLGLYPEPPADCPAGLSHRPVRKER